MSTILAVTVGGSCTPVVTAIQDYQPEFVVFIVSTGSRGSRVMVDGPGTPCRTWGDDPDKPNISRQAGLQNEQFEIVELTDPDSLHTSYAEIKTSLARVQENRAGHRFVADYTGGTKTMSVALALAGLEAGWNLSVVKGARTDLVQIVDGTEIASMVNTWEVRARQQVVEAQKLCASYAFSPAGSLLESLLQAAPLTPQIQQKIRSWVGLCRGFDAWDRFDHARAFQILAPYQSQIVPQWIFLKKLVGQEKNSGYEPAFDLFLNAQRRAARGRYDDAVARLYRTLEMLAQIHLSQFDPPLSTNNLDISALPEEIQTVYAARMDGAPSKDKTLKLGLLEAYELLVRLEDPLGKVFDKERNHFLAILEKRNYSILAHGEQPITEDDYQKMEHLTQAIIQQGLDALNIHWTGIQFPQLTLEI